MSINKTPKFFNKNGDLTAYAFGCGYIQFASKDGSEMEKWNNGKEMYHEGCVYQVKQYKEGKRILWESYHTLGEARKHYRSININN
jgi:hypothetical protein